MYEKITEGFLVPIFKAVFGFVAEYFCFFVAAVICSPLIIGCAKWLWKKLAARTPPSPPPPDDRPRRRNIPNYEWLGGAYPTTASFVQEFFDRLHALKATFELAGVRWPIEKYLNKFIFVTAKPGAGKTALMRCVIRDLARHLSDVSVNMRWLLLDPTGAYLKFIFQVLPPDIEILRATPHDIHGLSYNIAADIGGDEVLAQVFAKSFFAETTKSGNEPFWITNATELILRSIFVLMGGTGNWVLADLARMFYYSEFLAPILDTSPRSKGWVATVLTDRMGQGVITTATAQVNQLAMAAACMEHAAESFTFSGPKGVLNKNCVVHLEAMPHSMESMSIYANLLAHMMAMHAYQRNDEHNHSVIIGDEGRFLECLPIETINARGRGCGVSVVLTAVGVDALIVKWGENRVKELLSGVALWVAMSSDAATDTATANAFCKMVGDMLGNEISTTETTGETFPNVPDLEMIISLFSLKERNHRTASNSQSVTTTPRTKPLVIPSELTSLPQANRDKNELHAQVYCADVGCYPVTFPFLHGFNDLPPSLVEKMEGRPAEQMKLRRFVEADFLRLGIELTEEIRNLLKGD